MATLSAASIDINKAGKYPIVLSDALLGKAPKETYTSIRYNHKPDASAGSSLSPMQLQPSVDSDPQNFDLSFSDDSEKYLYHGTRTSDDGQYVLIFNPEKKHFVLHRIDSTFEMNLTSTPWDEDASSLRESYAQLEPTANTNSDGLQRSSSKSSKSSSTIVVKTSTKREKTKPPARAPSPENEDDDDDDSNDGLTIEYPDGPSSQQYQYQSTPIGRREASEEVSDEDEDCEHEDIEDERDQDVDVLELPSPVNNNAVDANDDDMEMDLEAELEQALKETGEMGSRADESSESEEE